MFPADLIQAAGDLSTLLRTNGVVLATAESCTGGLIAGLLTELPGSSDILDRGFVTYSNAAKQDMLGVPHDLLRDHGAVSEPVARAMAVGAVERSNASASIAVTGIAGPGGGTDSKPVGLVHIAAQFGTGVTHRECRFGDVGRTAVRLATIRDALQLLQGAIEQS